MTAEELAILSVMLLVAIAISLVALLAVNTVTKYLSVEKLEVANRIPDLLLAALAVETIINGLSDLLRDMGVIQG